MNLYYKFSINSLCSFSFELVLNILLVLDGIACHIAGHYMQLHY